jgi:uncharacterized protein YbjT (DUF2867 family)
MEIGGSSVLVCGANGFIGRHVCAALMRSGHRVLRGVRRPGPGEVAMDFRADTRVSVWLPRLQGVQAVVNAVGTIDPAHMDAIHRDAPIALFDACGKAGVSQVIQLSALGAGDESAATRFLQTKRAADRHLMTLPLAWTIVRPSLVAGADGASSRMFRALASLPVVPLPGAGAQQLQPVAVQDVADLIAALLAPGAPTLLVVDAVGPEVVTYRQMLQAYRTAIGLRDAIWLPVPPPVVAAAVAVASPLSSGIVSRDTLAMLEAGSTASPELFEHLLGRRPAPFTHALDGLPARVLRLDAVWVWAEPLLRCALALTWLVTALVSVFVYPMAGSRELLRPAGIEGALAPAAVWAAAGLDAAFGVLTLWRPSRLLWLAQIALILGYSLIVTVFLPQMWAHPFGPLLKNVPILAVLCVLLATTDRKL